MAGVGGEPTLLDHRRDLHGGGQIAARAFEVHYAEIALIGDGGIEIRRYARHEAAIEFQHGSVRHDPQLIGHAELKGERGTRGGPTTGQAEHDRDCRNERQSRFQGHPSRHPAAAPQQESG